MKTLCGLRPTGQLHIGHYFSVIEPALKNNADVLIAEYHAPNTSEEEIEKVKNTLNRFGVKNIIMQRDIFTPQLYFRMLNLSTMGELSRMTQFKESNSPNAHLFSYPVLMTCDVVSYDEVIVGDDQTQHLNFARDLIKRYNKKYSTNIILPLAKHSGGRIMSLIDSSSKMSKSSPNGCLFLDDSSDIIRRKIKKAVMDILGRDNLLNLFHKLGGIGDFEMNVDLKEALTEKIIHLTNDLNFDTI